MIKNDIKPEVLKESQDKLMSQVINSLVYDTISSSPALLMNTLSNKPELHQQFLNKACKYVDGIMAKESDHFTVSVRFKDGEFSGYMFLINMGVNWFVQNIWVDEKYRKQGVAKSMVDELIKHSNIPITLFSSPKSVEFWKKMGFSNYGFIKDKIVMSNATEEHIDDLASFHLNDRDEKALLSILMNCVDE